MNETAYDGDDATVIGGDFVVDDSGKVLYSYCSQDQFDRPQVKDLIKAIS